MPPRACSRGAVADSGGENKVQTRLNGEVRHTTSTSDPLFDIGHLLEFITEWITLEPGA